MSRERSMAERVAKIEPTPVQGSFQRHAAPNRDPYAGGFGGRWGAGFPVIYLGRPVESCVEEAYRHLVDDSGVPAEFVKARTLYEVEIEINDVLDLRTEDALATIGLSQDDLHSPVGEYAACQRVAAAAHQLELHAIIAPAATRLGSVC